MTDLSKYKIVAQDRTESDYFGGAVDLTAGPNNTLYGVVGAYGVDLGTISNIGAAYVFTLQNGNFVQSQKLMPSDGAASDYFGQHVCLDCRLEQ